MHYQLSFVKPREIAPSNQESLYGGLSVGLLSYGTDTNMNKIPIIHLITMLIILGGAVIVMGAAVYKLASWILSL